MTLVIAHRGASAYAPENTMPAFDLAVQQRADMIELDVQQSADGVLVVFHDLTTERWNGQARPIAEYTYAELATIDIHGARIPTLAEVCAFAREQRIQLNVELKGSGKGAATAQVLREERIEDQVVVSSFWPEALTELREVAPHLPRAYLMGTRSYKPDVRLRESWPFAALRSIEAAAWHPAYQIPLLARVIPRVQRLGVRVNVWTVNDVVVMQRLLALGVDGIITDTPDVLRGLMV